MFLVVAKVGTHSLEEVGVLDVCHIMLGDQFDIRLNSGKGERVSVRCDGIVRLKDGTLHYYRLERW